MLAKLIVVMCLWSPDPEQAQECDPPFEIPVQMTLQECALFGQQAAFEWLQQHPFFEFHELRSWRCEMGERA